MDNVQISDLLELSKETHETLGEILVLRAVSSPTKTCFTVYKGPATEDGEALDLDLDLRITKASARKLAAELLRLAGEA